MSVTLQPITSETVRRICAVKTTESQRRFVSPVAESIAEAYCDRHAEVRAVYFGTEPVGFLQWRDTGGGTAYLWRFLIDQAHQGHGHGRAAIEALMEELRGRGFTELTLSYVPAPDGPRGFYVGLGFADTGEDR